MVYALLIDPTIQAFVWSMVAYRLISYTIEALEDHRSTCRLLDKVGTRHDCYMKLSPSDRLEVDLDNAWDKSFNHHRHLG